jgi:septal ring factor EnvC (AmiA/AmiB activator)
VAESVSAAVKKSKELETLQASLAQEKQSFSAEMEQGKQMVASLSAAAEEKAKEYRALVAEYNRKLAKLKELAGG